MSTEYGLGASQSRVDQEYVSTVDAFSQMIRSIYEPNIMETAFKKFPLIKILIKMPLMTLRKEMSKEFSFETIFVKSKILKCC